MKKRIGLGLLLGVVALGIVFAGSAFAADPTPTPKAAPGFGAFGHMGGVGMMGLGRGGNLVDATRLASTLGVSVEDMTKQLQAGKSIAQIAQDQKVDIQKVVDTILAPKKDMIQVMVKYGYLNQDQANTMIQNMDQATKDSLNNTGIGGYGKGNRGPGMMGKFPGPRGGQGNPAPNTTPNNNNSNPGSSFRGGMMRGYSF